MRGILKNEKCKLKIANLKEGPRSFSPRFAPSFTIQFSFFTFHFAIVLLAATSSFAADAPPKPAPPGPESWPSFRNGNQQLGVATTKLPAKLEKLWTHEAGPKDGMVKSTAAIAGGRVY